MKCFDIVSIITLILINLFLIDLSDNSSFKAEGLLHDNILNLFSSGDDDDGGNGTLITIDTSNLKYFDTKILESQINLKYPSLWKNNVTENEKTFEIKQKDMHLLITLRNTTSDSLGELTFKQKNILRQDFPGIKNANSTKLKTDNFIGYKYTFEIDELKVMRIWTVNNGKDLLVTYIATKNGYDAYFPVIKKIINSIKFNY